MNSMPTQLRLFGIVVSITWFVGQSAHGGLAAHSDFNGDGFSDLAVGVPLEDVGAKGDAGAVNVIYGGMVGISATGDQLWSQDATGVPGSAHAGDQFGSVLASGDFDADGYVDLAVGVPMKVVSAKADAGEVVILYGSAGGLTATASQSWHLDSPGVAGAAASNGRFGSALAVGDFNGDGFDDLAIGIPARGVGGFAGAGGVTILFGSASGLAADNDQMWTQDSTGIADQAESGDGFGSALVAGNFDGDLYSDLAIGAPSEDVGSIADAGAVQVILGSGAGLSASGSQFWNQNSAGVLGSCKTGDQFGFALAVGDFDNDSDDDLAIGVPSEDVGSKSNAGAVNVLYGSVSGLAAADDQLWTQDSAGIGGTAETNDAFGKALATGDFDDDGFADLVVGVPDETDQGMAHAGELLIIPGSGLGLIALGSKRIHNGQIIGLPQAEEFLGASFAVADFNGDGIDDLVAGMPGISVNGKAGAGEFAIGYGVFGDNVQMNDGVWSQNWTGIQDACEVGDSFGMALSQ